MVWFEYELLPTEAPRVEDLVSDFTERQLDYWNTNCIYELTQMWLYSSKRRSGWVELVTGVFVPGPLLPSCCLHREVGSLPLYPSTMMFQFCLRPTD